MIVPDHGLNRNPYFDGISTGMFAREIVGKSLVAIQPSAGA